MLDRAEQFRLAIEASTGMVMVGESVVKSIEDFWLAIVRFPPGAA